MKADPEREKQIAEAEELLGDRLGEVSFAGALYFGLYAGSQLPEYPVLTADEQANEMVQHLRDFCDRDVW